MFYKLILLIMWCSLKYVIILFIFLLVLLTYTYNYFLFALISEILWLLVYLTSILANFSNNEVMLYSIALVILLLISLEVIVLWIAFLLFIRKS